MATVNEKMTAIANEIRTLSGTTSAMGLDAMATHVGNANSEVDSQASLIAQIVTALNGKALDDGSSGAVEVQLQDKTVTPTTSAQIITADSGYDGLDTVTVNAMPTATQATPSVTVNASGLITATTTQTAGYVSAGTKSGTKQLTTQSAKTVTPTTAAQTAVESGVYTTGKITVAGDSNLVAGNIKNGVSIFGVTGTLTAGSGGSTESCENEILEGSLVNYTNSTVSKLRGYAFVNCTSLKTVNLPSCSHIGAQAFQSCTSLTTASFETCISIASSAFQGCKNLTSISFPVCKSIYYRGFTGCSSLVTANFPSCTYIGGYAFQNCTKLTTLDLPLCKTIYSSTFQSCKALTTVSLPNIATIGSTAFGSCTKLNTFYLPGSTLCTLSNSNAFTGTGITSTAGSIYVNASLVNSYKAATNWTYFSNVIYAIE